MGWCEDVETYVAERFAEIDSASVSMTDDERAHIGQLLRQVALLEKPVAKVGGIARLSQDKRDGAGNARQTTDLLSLAISKELAVVELFIDTDRSASRFAMRKRERYDAALAALINGEIDGLVAYNLDRLWRRNSEAEVVFERVLTRRARCWSCQGQALLGPDDVFQGRLLVSVASNESDATSRRSKRAMETAVTRGVPHGGKVPYGRVRVLDWNGRPRGEWSVEPAEAAVIVEACNRVVAGEALSSIAADLNARGVPTRNGGLWRHTTVRSIVTAGHVAGFRRWEPGDVIDGRWVPSGVRSYIHSPVFEPIVSEDVWRAVCQTLADPVRRTTAARGGHERRHLASGFVVCGACGGAMGAKVSTTQAGRTQTYSCRECGNVRRSADAVDEFLREATLQWHERAVTTPGDPSAVLAARADLERVRLERGELAKMLAEGRLSAAGFAVADEALAKGEMEANAVLASAPVRKRKAVPRNRQQLEALWERSDLTGRRELVAATGLVVVVAPVGRGRHADRYKGLAVRLR